ncbi:MAG: cysteine synthase family protein [Propionibacteriaceae bacterium]|nr:cysteine synthase family protein [Propionibacteriaceae bacterium]
MSQVCHDVLEAIGHTPVVQLQRVVPPGSARIVVKLEGLNVGGSIKTRTAWNMIEDATARGLITPDTIICEPTSGNQGIGLALVGAVRGIRVRVIMPDSVSGERRKIIEAYGAEVVLVHDDGDIGACIDECLRTALSMAATDLNVFVPQQFENPANPAIHFDGTGPELLKQVGQIDGFCSGIGTGGTITGVGRCLREANPDVVIWAVEPEDAAILSGGPITSHVQMGIGDGLIPVNLDTEIYNDVAVVSDAEALAMAKRLAQEEGLLVGISSGSNVVAAVRLAAQLGPGKTVATILPDTGERYFSTPLYD